MPKNDVYDWDATAANNTDVGGVNIAEGMAPSDVNNAIREMMAQLGALLALNQDYVAGGGTADAQTATPAPPWNSLVAGHALRVLGGATNTGAMTLNVNGLGATNVKLADGSSDPVAGDVVSGRIHTFIYDGTNFRLLDPVVSSVSHYVTGGGVADAYTATPAPAWPTLAAGRLIRVKIESGDTNTGASTLNVSGLGATSIKTLDGNDPAAGDILAGMTHTFLYDGTTFALLDPAPPVVCLAAGTLSNDVSLELSAGDWSRFKEIVVRVFDLVPATDATSLYLRTSADGGASFASSAYSWANHRFDSSATHDRLSASSDSNLEICREVGAGTNELRYVEIRLQNPSKTAATFARWTAQGRSSAEVEERIDGAGARISGENVDAVQLRMSSGNIASGTYSLEGIR